MKMKTGTNLSQRHSANIRPTQIDRRWYQTCQIQLEHKLLKTGSMKSNAVETSFENKKYAKEHPPNHSSFCRNESSDESKLNLHGSESRVFIWSKPRKEFQPNCMEVKMARSDTVFLTGVLGSLMASWTQKCTEAFINLQKLFKWQKCLRQQYLRMAFQES